MPPRGDQGMRLDDRAVADAGTGRPSRPAHSLFSLILWIIRKAQPYDSLGDHPQLLRACHGADPRGGPRASECSGSGTLVGFGNSGELLSVMPEARR